MAGRQLRDGLGRNVERPLDGGAFACDDGHGDMEIVIVDNCSNDDDRLAVEELCQKKRCTFIANKVNKGYNAGNNVGLRYAAEKGYEYALIANPDMEFPQTDYLRRLLDIMMADDTIAVCGSDIITPEGIHQSPMKRDGDWRNSMGWFTE